MTRYLCAAVTAAFLILGFAWSPARASAPIPIRVVVVTTFEVGADTGDTPGEFQSWVARLPLPATLGFPLGQRHLRYNAARGVLGIVTGEGAERGAASIMALGTDPRFDFSHAYWIVAGIAGVDPNVASVGSAAWANWVVNGDLGFYVDPRDMPASWSTGMVPFHRTKPYAAPAPPAISESGSLAYELDAGLVGWAYRLTVAHPIADNANLAAVRAPYAKFPNGSRPPFVLRGESLASDRYWIGPKTNDWAEKWVSYWTGGHGTFAMSDEEDAGIMQSLTYLAQASRVDRKRVLVLRTASDYVTPGAGQTPASLLATDASNSGESAFIEAVEAAYRVGSVVVNELTSHWDRYKNTIPR